MTLTRFFSNFQVIDEITNKEIIPPEGYIFDYIDTDLGLVAFKDIESFSVQLINSFDGSKYSVTSPRSYKVIHSKVKLIKL